MDQDQPESSEVPGTPEGDGVGAPVDGEAPAAKPRGRFARFLRTPVGVILAVVVGLIVVLGIVIAIPATRYPVVGLVVKKDARITVVDSSTEKAVSGARVVTDGVSATTDSKGVATLHGVAVGPQTLQITKQYYKTSHASLLVPIAFGSARSTQRIVATGYPLEVHAVDRITGAVVAGAHIVFGTSAADTDSAGIAQVVLPITAAAQSGTVTKDGYNPQALSVDVTQHPDGATAQLTTSGTLRYLSKATGTINVMQANLDGTGATVVLAGTGNESDDTTTLLSTRDWKFSALLADRDGTREALYAISGTGQPVTVDASDARFTLIGWQDHTFFYEAELATPAYGVAGHDVLKAFNADSGKTVTVDKNAAGGSAATYFSGVYVQEGKLLYARLWSGNSPPAGSTNDFVSVDTVTFTPKVIKSFPTTIYLGLAPYEAQGLYIQASDGPTTTYSSYEDGALKPAAINDDKFSAVYPTYLQSPSGKQTLWAESRDGKNTIFIGDAAGANGTQIQTLSDYTPYGWYGLDDRYVLLTKNDSELYIAPAGIPLTATNVLKITDYHKPPNGYPGYGGGYGG